jgi:hypothetical protein
MNASFLLHRLRYIGLSPHTTIQPMAPRSRFVWYKRSLIAPENRHQDEKNTTEAINVSANDHHDPIIHTHIYHPSCTCPLYPLLPV